MVYPFVILFNSIHSKVRNTDKHVSSFRNLYTECATFCDASLRAFIQTILGTEANNVTVFIQPANYNQPKIVLWAWLDQNVNNM